MNAPSPLHAVPAPAKKPKRPRPRGLAATTWEQRRKLNVRQLIGLMGPLHVKHPDYKPRPRGVAVHVPNLAGRQPVIAQHHMSLWRLVLQTLRFALR